ncbi:MAG TPA: hypothetical protein DCE22_01045, partial [Verrucomicrobiales bacterium]|nr:hypothetical protein [Verrucomicrobiales bacterium]
YIDSNVINQYENRAINKIFSSNDLYPEEIQINVLGTDQSNSSIIFNVLPGKKHGGAVFYQGKNRERVLTFLSEVTKAKS